MMVAETSAVLPNVVPQAGVAGLENLGGLGLSHGGKDALAERGAFLLIPTPSIAGMGPIHMNEVRCSGAEKSLWSCPFKNITQDNCKHSEDAGVRCNVPYMGYETTVSWGGTPCAALAAAP